MLFVTLTTLKCIILGFESTLLIRQRLFIFPNQRVLLFDRSIELFETTLLK